jgi:HSP20 family molecular chaperone IbpA
MRVHAGLKDGVRRVSLPKAEAVKPRKIAVN